MATPAELSNLTRALKGLDQTIKQTNRNIENLTRIAEALNRNLVQLGRRLKENEENNEQPE
jgi:hypothetical protein